MDMKKGLAVGIIALLFVTSLTPLTIGYQTKQDVKPLKGEQYNYDSYHVSEIKNTKYVETAQPTYKSTPTSNNIPTDMKPTLPITLGVMDSAWPMYCHDLRHTGQSPYSTSDNPGIERWRFSCDDFVEGGGVLDEEGNIYFGSCDDYLYSLYPNGTLRWSFYHDDWVESSPAIDEDGVIYFGGSAPHDYNYFYAINPNGTLKWRYKTYRIHSSPAVDEDGTIYFGSENGYIYALNPNGTLKWQYKTNNVVYSSPAIDDDGIIYCGSHDSKLYALYPNGTLKWKFDTGNWIRTSPCIGDDGTIYCVSLDNYLYAVYPNNGTQKWRAFVNAGTSPTIGQDGTIYCGWDILKAINPDGSLKWDFNPGNNRRIQGGTPCHSADGTIYFGTIRGLSSYDGGEIIAVNPDGTEKWRKGICNRRIEFAPLIAEDGTIYIGSSSEEQGDDYGHLHAFNTVENNNPPNTPTINGPLEGWAGLSYCYRFYASDPDNHPVSFFIDWGDGESGWSFYYESNKTITIEHEWEEQGYYTIAVKARDSVGEESDWAYLEVTMPVNQQVQKHNTWFLQLLQNHPKIFPRLQNILNLN